MLGLLESTIPPTRRVQQYKGTYTRFGNNKILVEADIPEIFLLHDAWKMQCIDIAPIYSVTPSCILKVIHKKNVEESGGKVS